jgi:hypothetical protein
MTWYFAPSETTMDVYDHTGLQVATGREFGGVWSGDYPDEVLSVMQSEAEAAVSTGNVERALMIVSQAAFEDIEQGTPA